MKYIEIPETIEIFNINGERMTDAAGKPASLTFREFVLTRLQDPQFGVDMKSVMIAVEIKKQVDEANGVLELENEHWERLRTATAAPSALVPYNPHSAHNLVPFMTAITEPSESRPTEGAASDAPAAD